MSFLYEAPLDEQLHWHTSTPSLAATWLEEFRMIATDWGLTVSADQRKQPCAFLRWTGQMGRRRRMAIGIRQ